MEKNPRKQVGGSSSSSSSSFPSELFGTKEPSTNDVFASIFPPRKGVGNEDTGSWQKQSSGYQTWNSKQDSSTMDTRNHHHDSRGEPSHLSSSLFYGGREYDSQPPPGPHSSTGSYSSFKKTDAGGEEDDPTSASRGNWWQGSLYY